MSNKLIAKPGWLIFALLVGLMTLTVHTLEQVFFINRTSSMITGLYVKINDLGHTIGDIIIFKQNSYNGNLIKYVVSTSNANYCSDEKGTLWIDGIPVAQKNIEKCREAYPTQSICHTLKSDELLVLGDHPNSYDSRYFGPINKRDIIATVELVWASQ